MYVSRGSRYCHAQARTFARPSGRWQPRVKRCRTAARVKFCEEPRTYAHGSTTPMHLARVAHTSNAVCPQFFGHIPIYEKDALVPAVLKARILPEISIKGFPRKFVVGILL